MLLPSSVDLLVYFDVTQGREAFPARFTPVGLDPAVEALVADAVVLAGEQLATDLTAEGPLPRVDALVRVQPGPLRERLAALLTLVGLLSPVEEVTVAGLWRLLIGSPTSRHLPRHGGFSTGGVVPEKVADGIPPLQVCW